MIEMSVQLNFDFSFTHLDNIELSTLILCLFCIYVDNSWLYLNNALFYLFPLYVRYLRENMWLSND